MDEAAGGLIGDDDGLLFGVLGETGVLVQQDADGLADLLVVGELAQGAHQEKVAEPEGGLFLGEGFFDYWL